VEILFGVVTVGFVFASLSCVHLPLTLEIVQFFLSWPGHLGWAAARVLRKVFSCFQLRFTGAMPGLDKLVRLLNNPLKSNPVFIA